MKNLKGLKVVAFCLLTAMLISSCSMIKNNDFTSQKYTNFKRGESTAYSNRVVKEKAETKSYAVVSENKETAAPVVVASEPVNIVVASEPVIKKESFKTVKNDNFFTKITNKVNRKNAVSFIAHRFADKANTASVKGGDVDLLILVILAIFVPPLCAFLVRGLASEFWLDLLLTILFWVPGVIYALLLAFDIV